MQKFCDLVRFYKIQENRDLWLKKIYLKKKKFNTDYPTHYDLHFWDCSNAHYILPMLFGFRKNITSYEHIRTTNTLKQFTANHFGSQPELNREEIQNLLNCVRQSFAVMKLLAAGTEWLRWPVI